MRLSAGSEIGAPPFDKKRGNLLKLFDAAGAFGNIVGINAFSNDR
jgi:hypothetical protein